MIGPAEMRDLFNLRQATATGRYKPAVAGRYRPEADTGAPQVRLSDRRVREGLCARAIPDDVEMPGIRNAFERVCSEVLEHEARAGH